MSPINFSSVPSNFRLPFFSTEFTSGVNQVPVDQKKILLIGQVLSAGSAALNSPIAITDPSQLDGLFGAGSMLSSMGKASLKANKLAPTFAIAVADPSGGVAAGGSISFGGPATKAGTLAIYVGGVQYQIAVAQGDTAIAIATNVAAVLSADSGCFVAAVVDGSVASKVNLTAKHKGLVCNSLDVRMNYNPDDSLPAGVTVTLVALSGGSGTPSLSSAIAGMGETQYDMIAMPWTDASSLSAMEAELEDRWAAVRQIDGKLFCASAGSQGSIATLGESRNSKQDSIMDIQNSPSPVWIWAANIAAAVCASAQNDPALPLQTVPLTQVLAPALSDQRTLAQRNLLLFDGISSFKVAAGGQPVLERVISTYRTNAAGAADVSYLSIEKMLTLSQMRFEYNDMWASKYPQFKLGQDGTKYGPGQKIMTPKLARSEIVHLYADWCERGLAQNPDLFSSGLIVEINSQNPDRLDVGLDPEVMDQLIMVGSQIKFLF